MERLATGPERTSERLLTLREVAELLRLHPRTVRGVLEAWRAGGTIGRKTLAI
jgi:hypothetical protein